MKDGETLRLQGEGREVDIQDGGDGKGRRDSGFEGHDDERDSASSESRYRSGLGSRYEALMVDDEE